MFWKIIIIIYFIIHSNLVSANDVQCKPKKILKLLGKEFPSSNLGNLLKNLDNKQIAEFAESCEKNVNICQAFINSQDKNLFDQVNFVNGYHVFLELNNKTNIREIADDIKKINEKCQENLRHCNFFYEKMKQSKSKKINDLRGSYAEWVEDLGFSETFHEIFELEYLTNMNELNEFLKSSKLTDFDITEIRELMKSDFDLLIDLVNLNPTNDLTKTFILKSRDKLPDYLITKLQQKWKEPILKSIRKTVSDEELLKHFNEIDDLTLLSHYQEAIEIRKRYHEARQSKGKIKFDVDAETKEIVDKLLDNENSIFKGSIRAPDNISGKNSKCNTLIELGEIAIKMVSKTLDTNLKTAYACVDQKTASFEICGPDGSWLKELSLVLTKIPKKDGDADTHYCFK